jgi:hypothetical protein
MCDVFFERREHILESFAFCGRATLAVQFNSRKGRKEGKGMAKGKRRVANIWNRASQSVIPHHRQFEPFSPKSRIGFSMIFFFDRPWGPLKKQRKTIMGKLWGKGNWRPLRAPF